MKKTAKAALANGRAYGIRPTQSMLRAAGHVRSITARD
jgi:hypothetical protein